MVILYSSEQLRDFNNSAHRLDNISAKYIRCEGLSRYNKTHRGSTGSKRRIPIKISNNSLERTPCDSGQGVNSRNLFIVNIFMKTNEMTTDTVNKRSHNFGVF